MNKELIRDKIAKLLRLSNSSNEHEAKAALLKAQRLMAEHKLSAQDFAVKDGEVVRRFSGISFSKRGNIWIDSLSKAIAPNFCCEYLLNHFARKQMREVSFIGFAEDAALCVRLLQFAVDFVLDYRTKMRKRGLKGENLKQTVNGYGYGFAKGLEAALRKQRGESEEWGLVITVPQEAAALKDSLSTGTVALTPYPINKKSYGQGYQEGMAFNHHKYIE